jgi:hypothetical protein
LPLYCLGLANVGSAGHEDELVWGVLGVLRLINCHGCVKKPNKYLVFPKYLLILRLINSLVDRD